MQLLILSGQRRNEIAGLRWSELDLDKGLWTLPDTRAKNNTKHELPLSEAALECSAGSRASGTANLCSAQQAKRTLLGHRASSAAARGTKVGAGIDPAARRHCLGTEIGGSFAGIVGTYQRYSYNDEKRAVLEAWARFVAPRDKPAHNVIPLRTYRDFETVLPACYPLLPLVQLSALSNNKLPRIQ